MAVPKKRTSSSRRGIRRAGQHHKLYGRHSGTCPNCGAMKLSHAVCTACGTYKGREVIPVKAEEDEEDEERS